MGAVERLNRVDQYDVVHAVFDHMYWSTARGEYVTTTYMRCGTRLVTADTNDPVNCFNCLTNARDWKYG